MSFIIFRYIFLASTKSKKLRSPVIEDVWRDTSSIIQTPIPQTVLKKGQ